MATATPSPTPNPDAMKFTLDSKLPATINFTSAESAAGNAFATSVFAAVGVAAVFGVNDFVTITRTSGAAWDQIITAVQAAAGEYL
jgi:hypothetical protein